MKKIAILHTTPSTVPVFEQLLRGKLGEQVVIENFVDDSILPMLAEDAGSIPYAFEKLLTYCLFAQKQGAVVILNACSSVGEFAAYARPKLEAALIRVDEAAAEIAVQKGRNIAVLATLKTTLAPSSRLVQEKGAETVTPVLVENAFAALKSGDIETHDALLVQAITRAAAHADVVYLAQASMARVMPRLEETVKSKVVYSTESAVEAVVSAFTCAK